METRIADLVAEIKKDTRYLSFLIQEEKLQDPNVQQLLKAYQEAQEELQEVKKYQEYIAIDTQVEAVKQAKIAISKNEVIQEYYQAYHEVNSLLDEVTKIVFAGISSELSTDRYVV